MRQPQGVENRIKGVGAEIIDAVERCRRGQQVQMVVAFRHQTLDERAVGPFVGKHRVGDALQRILVVVEAGGAERKVEVDDHRIQRQVARDRPCHVVGDGGGADAALGADDRDDPTDRDGFGRREQAADGADHIERRNRPDHVIADAAPYEFAIGRDIVIAADHDHARSGVAYGGEFIETGKNVFVGLGLQNDDVRGRDTVIGLDGGHHAAHFDREMRFGETPVETCGLHRIGRRRGFAESLHRDPRSRRDIIIA